MKMSKELERTDNEKAKLERRLQRREDQLKKKNEAGFTGALMGSFFGLAGVATELSRCEAKLAKGLPATLKRGEFRRNGEGAVWQTVAKAKVGEASVPAVRYTEHPHTGRLRCTEEMGSLPAHRRGSQPCAVTTREPQPEAEQGAETARKVAAALDADEPHTALAPHG